jgi:cytidylate kinase
MGTVVFPDAAHKFFLTADLRTRALRRGLELGRDRGGLDEVLEQLEQRDRRDSSRSAAPLRAADDAVVVDTSNMEIDDVVAELLAIIAAGEAADPSPDGGA